LDAGFSVSVTLIAALVVYMTLKKKKSRKSKLRRHVREEPKNSERAEPKDVEANGETNTEINTRANTEANAAIGQNTEAINA